VAFFLWLVLFENRTREAGFDSKELTQVLAPSKRRRYMRAGAILPQGSPHRKVLVLLFFSVRCDKCRAEPKAILGHIAAELNSLTGLE